MYSRRTISNQSQSFQKKRQSRLVWTIALIIVSVIAWLFSFSRLSNLQALSIDTVVISGADADISGRLEYVAERSIQGAYLGIFSKSDIFLYPKNALLTAIRAASPRIKSVDVSRQGRTLTVMIVEKTPAAAICTNLPDWDDSGSLVEDQKENCYLADASGLLYMSVHDILNKSRDRYFIPDLDDNASSSEALIGTHISTTTDFQALQAFSSVARSRGIDIQAILSHGNGEYEIYAMNPSPSSGRSAKTATSTVVIYVSQHNGFDNELTNLISFWSNALDKAHSGGEWPVFDYIDVRYGSNVFFRMVK